jgi:NADPH:quinone reductase-like Zn-dependent oxidoreductase
MHGVVTDSSVPGGLRLADDLPEPQPRPHELVLAVRAFSINAGEVSLIEQRPDGWLRPRIGWTADWMRTVDAFAAMGRPEFRGKAVLTVPASS